MYETRSESRPLDALDPLHLSGRADGPATSRAEKGTDATAPRGTSGSSPSAGPVAAPDDAALCAEHLRSALRRHGITLPSLGVDLAGFASTQGTLAGLVALGNCNLPTARALTSVLREAAKE